MLVLSMKSIHIYTQFPRVHPPQRFKEESISLNLDVRVIPYKKVGLSIEKNRMSVTVNGETLEAPDYAIFRSPGANDKYLASQQGIFKWLITNRTRILNYRTILSNQVFDKLMQHTEFARADLPHINSQIFMDLELLAASIKSYPMILKSFVGSHGDKVKKVEKLSDIFFFEKTDAPILVQPFLKVGQDIRVIVLGGKALGAMKRIAPEGKYLTNFSAGGEVEEFDLESNIEVKNIAERTARHFECEYVGVDLISDDDGNWVVLEVNRFCQFEGFEKSTGINVAKSVIEYLQNS